MDIRSLKYFIAVYESRNISGAAKRCFVAQPSVSAAIRQLEDTLGTQLFLRHARGVNPTEDAHKLLPYARQLTNDFSAMSNLFRNEKIRQPFRLGLMRSLGSHRMGLLLRDFGNRVETLELTLVEPEEPCDARIITTNYLTEDESFNPIWRDEYLLAVPSDHPYALRSRVSLVDLHQLPFISRTPCEALVTLQKAMLQEKLTLDIRARIHTLEYAQAMVQAGVGCALMPDMPALLAQPGIRFLEVEGLEMTRTIGLALPASPDKTQALEELTKVCHQVALLTRT